jgi:quinol monooxygenase YgiN
MNAKPITVVATFKAKPEKQEELKKALLALIGPTHQEAGCINYDLHQLQEDPARFLFHENWTSRAHLDAHLQNTHLQALLSRLDDLCVGLPEITIWDRIA